ncbi:hypothetical protein CesoFtcFv8_016337 [Champsocephalus esox]|uniref:Uncharacterized protein n=2 Tax=Champsocephalus TaxID=52236 RepID=A0AAN8DDA5_CHAGU|nr:hypothetical protein CesoFtcFv8_016337 [Champsocephalus esox]KAK5918225.1 hypothetical protein CgunFtcFv8_003004 [Champsocephalus gunnari]
MDACHHAAKLFRVWGTREPAGRIGWTQSVIGPPPHAWLLFRPVHPGFLGLKPCEKAEEAPRLSVRRAGQGPLTS